MSCTEGSCNCEGASEDTGQRTCWSCSPCAAKRTEKRLAALFACEPFCRLPGCGPVDCKPCRSPKGERGYMLGGKFFPLDAIDCAIFGPHANCERRLSEFSPTDIKNIIDSFSAPEDFNIVATNIFGTWWAVPLGSLAVAHVVCLLEYGATGQLVAGGNVVLPVFQAGITGLRQACADPPQTGSRVWVIDKLCRAEPGSDITAGRCRCIKPPCQATPALGGEVVMMDLGFDAANLPGGVGGITLSGQVRRCDWLLCVSGSVCPIENRILVSSLPAAFEAPLRALRVEPGAIPFAP